MNKILLLCALALTLQASAQTAAVPEFKNKVMTVQADNSLGELDKTDMSSNLHTSMGGHTEVNLVANGKNASLSRSGGPSDKYIVKIEPGIDPSNVVELFIFGNIILQCTI